MQYCIGFWSFIIFMIGDPTYSLDKNKLQIREVRTEQTVGLIQYQFVFFVD